MGIFGDVCPLHDQIYKLWGVLNHPSIKAVKLKFTRISCAYVTWQVLEETRLFFISGWEPMNLQIGEQEYSPQLIYED